MFFIEIKIRIINFLIFLKNNNIYPYKILIIFIYIALLFKS